MDASTARHARRWIATAALTVALLAGSAMAAVPGGGHGFGGGAPPARGFGRGGQFGRPAFRHEHHPDRFIFTYPYPYPYNYPPYYEEPPYYDAYCDPWSAYYSLELCYER